MRETGPPRSGQSDQTAAVAAGFIGWMLDAFDYFLVIYCLTAIAKDFGRSDKEMALATTVTLAFRPLGAFIFGLLADRYGRRRPLMLNLIFYSTMQVAAAFAPDYRTFIILRALFGVGMGGEWGLGASLTMEKVPARLRGLLSGFLQEGYAAGNLLAVTAYFLLFEKWGWRPLFLLGGLPALLAIFIRLRVKESEVWQKTRHTNWPDLWRGIAANRKIFLYLVLFITFMSFASHGTQDMYPVFLQRYWKLDTSTRSIVSMISMGGAILGGVAFGYYSDRRGRRRAVATSLALACVAIPLWALAPNLGLLMTGAFLMQFMVQGAWGVVPAHLSELTPDSVRGFVPGFAYQMGVLFGGSIVYLQALLAEHLSYAHTMAITALVVFAGGGAVALMGPEKRGQVFGDAKILETHAHSR